MPNIHRLILMTLWGTALLGASAFTLVQTRLPVVQPAAAATPPWAHLQKRVVAPLPMQVSAAGQAPDINTTNVTLPEGLLPAIQTALAQQSEGASQFLLASLRQSAAGDWAILSYAPVDGPNATETYIGEGTAARVLLAQRTAAGWVAQTQTGDAFDALLAQAPPEFISPAAKTLFLNQRRSNAVSAVDYKWPWAIGLSWRWMQGWHYKSAHDIGTDGNDKRVLASADGVITYVCQGNLGAAVRIKHADGQETGYWHINAGQLAPGIAVLQTVKQGQMLGVLRPGSWTDTQGCQQYTSQTANSAHVHWELPGDFTVEGWTISASVSAFSKDSVTKTCSGGCWQAANFFTSSNNPSGNPTPTPTATALPTATPTPAPVNLSLLPTAIYTRPNMPVLLAIGISNTANISGVTYSLAYSSSLTLVAITATAPMTVPPVPTATLLIAQAEFSATQYGIASVNFATVTVTGTNGLTRSVLTHGAQVYIGGCAGDFDLDSGIELNDVQQVALHWPSQISDTVYAADYDVDGSAAIDIADLQRVAYRIGSTCLNPVSEPITASLAITAPNPALTLTLQPVSATTFVGNVFTVTVMISEVAPLTETLDLGAFALEVTHEITALRVLTITPGDLLLNSGRNSVSLPIRQSAPVSGTQSQSSLVGMVSLGVTPTLPFTSGVLAILTLQALDIGTHPWQLLHVQFTDKRGMPIPAQAVGDMQLEVTEGHRVWLPVLILNHNSQANSGISISSGVSPP